MGLLNKFDNTNLVKEQELTVTYSRQRINGSWSYASGTTIQTFYSAWEHHRIATCAYRYVGMDYDTAVACAAALNALFNRDTKYSEWVADQQVFVDFSGGKVLTARCVPQHDDGCMWSVSVQVSEDDAKIRREPTTPSSLFPAEDSRAYYLPVASHNQQMSPGDNVDEPLPPEELGGDGETGEEVP